MLYYNRNWTHKTDTLSLRYDTNHNRTKIKRINYNCVPFLFVCSIPIQSFLHGPLWHYFYRNTCRKRPFNKFKYPRGTDVTQNVGIKRASFPGNVIPWSDMTIPNNLWENLSAYDHAWTGYKYVHKDSYVIGFYMSCNLI